MDHSTVIALPVVLILIFVGWTLYLRANFKRKVHLDLERHLSHHGPPISTTSSQTKRSSIFKLNNPLITRKDSTLTTSSSSEDTPPSPTQEKRKWPSKSLRKSQPNTSTSSLDQYTLPLTSTERPAPIHLGRISFSKSRPRVLSSPLPITNPHYHTAPAGRASLSPTQYDTRWWNEVARRGSTSNAMRRLGPILEPEVRGWEYEGRVGSMGVGHGEMRDERKVTRKCHGSWSGSRCESIVYDWTRPTHGEVQERVEGSVVREGHGKSGFRNVVWDGEGGRKSLENGQCVRRDESVQRMDWALMM